MIEYGHDLQGGFYAIDRTARIAYYAYPSSDNASDFKNENRATRFLPELMRREEKASRNLESYPERYAHLVKEFDRKVKEPKVLEVGGMEA